MSLSPSHTGESPIAHSLTNDPQYLDLITYHAWQKREYDRPRARSLAQQVIDSTDDPLLSNQAHIVLAYVVWREGLLAEALEHVQPALMVMRELGTLNWLARALNVRIGVTCELGEFSQGVILLEEQLRVSQEAGDLEMEACAIHDMGHIHIERNPAKAEPFFHRALELFREAHLVDGQAYSLLNLAAIYDMQGQITKERQMLSEAFEIAEHHHLESVKTHIIAQRGRLELAKGQTAMARDLFREALERAEKMGERPLAEAMPSLVTCYRKLGHLSEAKEVLLLYLAKLLQNGFLPFALQAHELLSDIFESEGHFQASLHHAREHLRLYKQVYARSLAPHQICRTKSLDGTTAQQRFASCLR
jgi:tetratricopeptide (TPR) repeat protein